MKKWIIIAGAATLAGTLGALLWKFLPHKAALEEKAPCSSLPEEAPQKERKLFQTDRQTMETPC